MKLKQLMNFEMDRNKKSSLQVKAIKALAGFLILMFLLTILSRAADSLTIAKVTATTASGTTIGHNIETDGSISANKDMAISTSANIKIASVEATEGKSVKKGDLLIQLDMDDLKKKLLQAQKELAVLEATASDKAANEAIAQREKDKNLNRTYEDANQSIEDAEDAVKKAKKEMNNAYDAYQEYKKHGGGSDNTDTTVRDSLQKTVEEKQEALKTCENDLNDINQAKDEYISKLIHDKIDEWKRLNLDADGNPMTPDTNDMKEIEAAVYAENKDVIDSYEEEEGTAKQKVEEAQAALSEAENALSTYDQEQSANNQETSDEQLKALYDDYLAKKDAYNEAKKQKEQTVKSANRTLEDANAPENVDTASALTEGNDLELKQLEVDQLQKIMDAEGKIVAPADGLVTKVLVTTGEVTTEDTAIRMADQNSGYKFTATLDKATAKYLSKGDKVMLDIGNDTTVEGLTIDDIAVSAEDNNSYTLTVSIPAKVKNLGSMATMKIDKASKKYDTCLPLNAIHSDGEKYFVYVISEKESILGVETAVNKVEVEVLDKNNELAAIEGYFDWNQQFVLTSSKTLREGDRVRLMEAE